MIFFDYFFYVIEIIIITIIISILHLHKLLVIRNDRRHRALFLLILLDYLYFFFLTQNVENMFEFAVNARRETRFFRSDGNIRSPVMIWIDELSRQT